MCRKVLTVEQANELEQIAAVKSRIIYYYAW